MGKSFKGNGGRRSGRRGRKFGSGRDDQGKNRGKTIITNICVQKLIPIPKVKIKKEQMSAFFYYKFSTASCCNYCTTDLSSLIFLHNVCCEH
jgi:hypothetical protein